ncbi:MAG: hypothetical protein Q7R35_14600, partial [Elusimicrobiota bacterium]|nr:hypothetical protein [Elusimicrobiota bacterium]
MNTKLLIALIAALALASTRAFAEGGMEEHKGHAGMVEEHMNCPEQLKGVKTEKKAVENGIEITMTAETPEAASELQENAAAHRAAKDCPLVKGGEEVSVENIKNGVKISITTKKPAAVKKLQNAAKKAHSCSCCGGGEEKPAVKGSTAAYVCQMGCS